MKLLKARKKEATEHPRNRTGKKKSVRTAVCLLLAAVLCIEIGRAHV